MNPKPKLGPLNWYQSRLKVWQITEFKIEIPDAELRELEGMVLAHLERWAEKKMAESGEKKPALEIKFDLKREENETD